MCVGFVFWCDGVLVLTFLVPSEVMLVTLGLRHLSALCCFEVVLVGRAWDVGVTCIVVWVDVI